MMMSLSLPRWMHCILFLALASGLVMPTVFAADGANPKPCKDPWECYEKPIIDGSPSGPSSLCVNVDGSWSIYNNVTPGKATRCDEERSVGVNSGGVIAGEIIWQATVTGPNGFSRTYENDDGSFSDSYSDPGAYTVTWTGGAYSDEIDGTKVCDDPDSVEETTTFQVVSDEPDFYIPGSVSVDPHKVCPGSNGTVEFSILDFSACWKAPYVVTWKIEKSGGDPTVTFTPSSGSVTITSQYQMIDVPTSMTVAAGSWRGGGTLLVTAKRDSEVETKTGNFTVPEPKATISFGAPADLQGRPLGTSAFYPGSTFLLPYTTENTGDCTETFDDVINCASPFVKITSGKTLTLKLASKASRLYHARIHISNDAPKGEVQFFGLTSAYGELLDDDTSKITIIKCEASPVTRSEEVKFDINESKLAPFLKVTEKITNALKGLPGATITPNKPKFSGTYKQTWGEECCPNYADPTPYSEHKATFDLGMGATAAWNPAFQPIFWFKLPGGQRAVAGKAFVGLITQIKVDAAAAGGISGRNSICTDCIQVSGKVSLSAAGSIKVGAEGKVFYRDVNGEEYEFAAELTGTGEIKAEAGSIEGTVPFGSNCKPVKPLRGCFGPVTASAEIRIKLGFFSAKLPKWSYEVIGKHCWPSEGG